MRCRAIQKHNALWLVGSWRPSPYCARGPTQALEPAREFIDALRERGFFEEAIEYLDQIEATDNPAVPVNLKETICMNVAARYFPARLTSGMPPSR